MEELRGGGTVRDIKLPLAEFLESFPPPQTGRIVEGYKPEFDDALDIQQGGVLKFLPKVDPNVPLSFRDPYGGGRHTDAWVKITLPIEFQGRFKLLSYDPRSDDYSPDHVFDSVGDLVEAFPVYAQANQSYGDKQLYPNDSFDRGDQLKLIRLVFKNGEKNLECRLLNESRLLLLPLDCIGNFTTLPNREDYLLADLAGMIPRRRRLQLSDDPSNTKHKIPGLPAKFRGDLFMEVPETFIEASPVNEPGLIIGLPHNIDMTVSPDEAAFDRGHVLNNFSTNNRNLFPVVARITDWDEETTILENHFIRPGVELVIHGWTRQSKILARSDDRYFAIPLTYQGLFCLKSQAFFGVSDLENAHPAYKLQVIELDNSYPNLPVAVGDVLRIRREDTTSRSKSNKPDKDGEVKYLKCEKVDASGKTKEIKLPMGANMKFEELLEDRREDYQIRELVTFVTEQEVTVELVKPSYDQKNFERDLPLGKPIVLCDFVVEPAVYVSVDQVDTPAFHIPLRTLIYVTFVEQLEKSSSPLLTRQNPKLSTLDRCAEILPLDVYNALRPQRSVENSSVVLTSNPPVPQMWKPVPVGARWPESKTYYSEMDDMSIQGRTQAQSYAESDVVLVKSNSKGLGSKLKGKFRKHKSSENVSKVGGSEFASLSLPRQQYNQHEFSLTVSPDGQTRQQGGYSNQPTYTTIESTGEHAHVTRVTANGQVITERPASQQGQSQSQYSRMDSGLGSLTAQDLWPESHGNKEVRRPVNSVSSTQSSTVIPSPVSPDPEPVVATTFVPLQQQQQPQQVQMQVQQQQQRAPAQHHVVINSPQTSVQQQGVGSPQPMQQPPPGYALVPLPTQQTVGSYGQMSPVPAVPPGYMLVPVMPQQQMMTGYTAGGQRFIATRGGSLEDDEEDDRASTITFSRAPQFKVVIPEDGNLYHFSVRKMAEFLRQLRIEDGSIHACINDKIDGKKFSRMSSVDLDRYGLMHPVVMHFRKLTRKKKTNFML